MEKTQLKSAIIGMVLGDGNLQKRKKCRNACLRINHSIKQREYLEWKAKIIEEITSCKIRPYKVKIGDKEYDMINLSTPVHPYFTRLYERFYWHGRKTINAFIMKRLTPIGLAIWIMDDGYYDKKNGIQLATYCFNEAEHWLMKWWIEKIFNIKVFVRSIPSKKRYYVQIGKRSTYQITKLVKDLSLPDCMKYKFSPYEEPPRIIRDEKTGRFVRYQYPRRVI